MRRHLQRRGIRLKYLNQSGFWPSGNPRFYYRPPGRKGVPLPDLPADDPAFLAAYSKAAGARNKPKSRTGTLGAAVDAFLASDAFLSRATSTRGVWRRMLDDMTHRYGTADFTEIQTRNIRTDLARLGPHPANNRLKVWRALMRWAVDAGLLDVDPARDVRPRQTPDSDGHIPWTREDFAAFRAHWPLASRQRLAFELMHLTCASVGDAVRLGPGMVSDGWLIYERRKSGSMATCPIAAPAPAWSEPDGLFLAALDAHPRHMTYMVTERGGARSHKAAASWFSRACTAAGLPDLSAHGIRKGRAAIFKENGASPEQRMAWMGHETEAEARGYSKSADLRRVVAGNNQATNFPTELKLVPTRGEK